MKYFVKSCEGKMMTQHPSTSVSPDCCEYHNKRCAKKCKSQEMSDNLQLPTIHEMRKQPCGSHLGVILYIILAVVLLVISITELVLTIGGSFILVKDLHAEIPGRLAGIVLLGICAAVIVVAVAFAIYAVSKKDRITLQTVSTIMAILAICEILVVIFAVTIKKADNDTLESTLTDTFLLAVDKQDDASITTWDTMQTTLKCCGLIGPDDYYIVPMSCCPSTTKSSEFDTNWQREICVINKSYHLDGCVARASVVLGKTVHYLSVTSLVFVILEVLLSGVGFYLVKISNHMKNNTPPLTNEKSPEDPPE